MPSGNATIGNLALRVRMKGRFISDLGRPAVVFAPHPDDETLGCGGTIIRKLAQGAKVEVVFLTDGTRSHDLIPASELGRLRRAEALKACGALGLDESQVRFLGLEDGLLAEQEADAFARVSAVLKDSGTEEVFVTHRNEPSADHATTNRLVRRAVQQLGRPMAVWEYPIWYWDSWPWVRLNEGYWRHPWAVTKAVARGLPSLLLPTRFNCAVDVSQQLDAKRLALAQHRTQVTRFNGDPSWMTLGDQAGGQFLEMLFQPRELFLKYDVP